jgi:hypothetical protein
MGSTAVPCTPADAASWLSRLSRGFQQGAWVVVPVGLAVLVAVRPARSAESSTITLRDGSQINGEIVSLRDGVYTITSSTLGTLTVKQAEVSSVTNGTAGQASTQLDAVKEQLTADPDTMRAIAELMDVPDVQAVLNDPDIRTALQSGNLDALLSNPKLLRLADDPRFLDITKKIPPQVRP